MEPWASGSYNERCTKIGTKNNGEICPIQTLCKSGFSIGYDNGQIVNDDTKKKCFSVSKDASCEYSSVDNDYYCRPIVEGLDIFTFELYEKCNNINNVYICPYTKGKEKCFREYISALNSIDIKEVYEDEQKYHLVGYGDNDLSQAYQKYKYYDELYVMGILNADGNINENKEDEWEFFWRFNHSCYNKFSIFSLFLILLI